MTNPSSTTKTNRNCWKPAPGSTMHALDPADVAALVNARLGRDGRLERASRVEDRVALAVSLLLAVGVAAGFLFGGW